jgi:hypothetical protein
MSTPLTLRFGPALALLFCPLALAQQTIVIIEADRDNTLYETQAGDLSNGAGQWLYFGRTNVAIRRALLRFDTTTIPIGASVLDATLTIEVDRQSSGAPPVTARLHRMASDWGEGASNAGSPGGSGASAQASDATWIHRFFDQQDWSTPGGDFALAPSASVSIDGLGLFDFAGSALRSDVQSWVDDPSTNHGWMIRGDEVSSRSARRMGSRENNDLASSLMVTYEAPETPTFPGIGPSVQGSWFNPERNGEGFVFDFFTRGEGPDNLGLVVYFYTYDLNDRPLYLVGSAEGLTPGSTDPILVEVAQTQGTSFGPNFDGSNVVVIPWGDLEIEFLDCNSAEVRWFPIALGYGDGASTLERLVPLTSNVECGEN